LTSNNFLDEFYKNVFSLKFLSGVIRNILTIITIGITLYILREIYPITSEIFLLFLVILVGIISYFCLPFLLKEVIFFFK
jgi:hypothetical protein